MSSFLLKAAAVLCIVVQAWLGCVRGPGRDLCIQTHFEQRASREVEREPEVAQKRGCCSHHHAVEEVKPKAPEPARHDRTCCIDVSLPDMTARGTVVDLPMGVDVQIGLIALPADVWAVAWVEEGADHRRVRPPPWVGRQPGLLSGVLTTRLIL